MVLEIRRKLKTPSKPTGRIDQIMASMDFPYCSTIRHKSCSVVRLGQTWSASFFLSLFFLSLFFSFSFSLVLPSPNAPSVPLASFSKMSGTGPKGRSNRLPPPPLHVCLSIDEICLRSQILRPQQGCRSSEIGNKDGNARAFTARNNKWCELSAKGQRKANRGRVSLEPINPRQMQDPFWIIAISCIVN